MPQTYGRTLFAKAAADVGMHARFHVRRQTCRASPLGLRLGSCTYCGFCEKFACGNYSKASAQTTIIPVDGEIELHPENAVRSHKHQSRQFR
jgi:gluconate 2-dehydrogenase alpha chain